MTKSTATIRHAQAIKQELETSFLQAAKEGDLNAVLQALDAGVNIEATGPGGYGALWNAATHGHFEIAQALLVRGASTDPVLKDDSITKPLHAAIEAIPFNLAMVTLLLDHGANIRAKGECLETPLYSTIIHNRFEVAEMLMARGVSLDENNDFYKGSTALKTCFFRGKFEMAKFFVAKGARLDSVGLTEADIASKEAFQQARTRHFHTPQGEVSTDTPIAVISNAQLVEKGRF